VSDRSGKRRVTDRGVKDAERAAKLSSRKPTDADRPKPSTFPGPKPKLLPGQLDMFGGEVPGVKDGES